MDDETIARMERILLATWPPLETAERGGWVAGANGGFTGRANSVTVLARTSPDDIDALLGWVQDWYQRRQAPPAFRLTPLSADLGPPLTDRGYRWWRNGASVMVGELSPLTGLATPRDYLTTSSPAADDDWYGLSGHGADARATLSTMFDGVAPPSLHVTISHDRGSAAIGRGVVHDGHLAIFGMETAPEHRRRGLARAVIGHLARWAVDLGAVGATLQVELGNDGAHALYDQLGFTDLYEYTYVALER